MSSVELSPPPDFKGILQEKGLRMTHARHIILDFLHQSSHHHTPEEMLVALETRGTPLSVATLYQNLRQLAECEVLGKFTDARGLLRYDINQSRHDHLVCEMCGHMIDVEPQHSLQLKDELSDGWRIRNYAVEFRGICPDCQITA